jgi:hypothetical protein
VSASSVCDAVPPASDPLVQPVESRVPDALSALDVNPSSAGNIVFCGSDVEVCANESRLMNCTIVPTDTVVIAGAKPMLLPYGVAVTDEDVNETSITVVPFVVPPPAGGAPEVQPTKAMSRSRARRRTAPFLPTAMKEG